MSPFTAPFSVCQTRDLVVADPDTRSTRPPSPANDVAEWWMDGGVVADLPIPPMAEKIAAMSTSIVHDFTPGAATMTTFAPPLTMPPLTCDRSVPVLRV
jgi:predicted acylesterase/phospholipase RssA